MGLDISVILVNLLLRQEVDSLELSSSNICRRKKKKKKKKNISDTHLMCAKIHIQRALFERKNVFSQNIRNRPEQTMSTQTGRTERGVWSWSTF